MFQRGFDELKSSWHDLNKSRKNFIIVFFNYVSDKITPKWINYLLMKNELKNRKTIDNEEGAVNTINFLYQKKEFNKKQRDNLINIIDKIPKSIKKSIQ